VTPPPILDRSGYELEVEDDFAGSRLNDRLWIPSYLPHWSSHEASRARYTFGDGCLRLRIEADQSPWCPELDGWTRVSSLQTGVFAGPRGSRIGQHHFREGLVVRDEVENRALYTPMYGLFELRARALADPDNMVALWMIGYEDRPERSAEICVFEIFGRDVRGGGAAIGMGVHPFGDPAIRDEFARERIAIDPTEFHTYGAMWTPHAVAFYVDGRRVKIVHQSPAYPMQFMLGIYEFSDGPELRSPVERYPKEFVVDYFRGYRGQPTRSSTSRARSVG
jgi:Glycosyl hydrolases family 16